MQMNFRRRREKLDCMFLSIGLFFTFSTSIVLLSWHDDALVAHDPWSFLPTPHKIVTDKNDMDWPPVLSAYVEPTPDGWYDTANNNKPIIPLPTRRVSKQNLTRIKFPSKIDYSTADTTFRTCQNVPSLLPVDEFGSTILDPYLPWLHDIFVNDDGTQVNVIAQNRRRCHKGKHHMDEMKFWEGQVALFQPVSIQRLTATNNNKTITQQLSRTNVRYRLSTHADADTDGIETRFICVFKTLDYSKRTVTYAGESLSTYPFNYEFVNWRKQKNSMVEDGKEQSYFWLSPLMFHCPIPSQLQRRRSDLVLDIVPIRTPVRRNDRDGYFFHKGHGGPMTFDASMNWGTDHVLPKIEDSGRWENLPVCHLPKPQSSLHLEQALDDTGNDTKTKPHRLVACTWTSALHQRRGNERRIADGKARLREWIIFNLEVGVDHIYVFDNTRANSTIFRLKNEVDPDADSNILVQHDDLSSITDLFPPSRVTRIDWPATVCNNNRPAHDDPGERSSQYAAEAACRSRYGPYTDWMASMDPDEYFVPMGNYTSWKEILDKIDHEEGRKILKFRSTRARPVLSALVPIFDDTVEECTQEMAKKHNPCLTKSDDKSFLETYNCEYIKSPKPDRFARAMKQIYRPDFVLSHFVHYSTVTADLATEKQNTLGEFIRLATNNDKMERWVNELEEGVLIHAKTTVPAETFSRETVCVLNAPSNCLVGIPCPYDLPFSDALHTKNVFHDEDGKYCNCWKNRRVEDYWLPKLNNALSKIGDIRVQ